MRSRIDPPFDRMSAYSASLMSDIVLSSPVIAREDILFGKLFVKKPKFRF
jgi:hypothetical protein